MATRWLQQLGRRSPPPRAHDAVTQAQIPAAVVVVVVVRTTKPAFSTVLYLGDIIIIIQIRSQLSKS
eukprot:SAG25_NODE_2265_length_1772_cov_1.119546_1_plen_67_part_00